MKYVSVGVCDHNLGEFPETERQAVHCVMTYGGEMWALTKKRSGQGRGEDG